MPKDVPFFRFNTQGHMRSSDNLRDWISQLPKPAAIMASYDALGTQAIECCNALKIPVPEQVAIIGVDNETTICDSTSPALTSIEPDICGAGQRAVDELERLMRARKRPRAKNIVLNQLRLIKRGSTAPIAPSASLVDRCLKLAECLLRETNYSIDLVSEKCGYGQSTRLKYIFKDKHGLSMSEWRKAEANAHSRATESADMQRVPRT